MASYQIVGELLMLGDKMFDGIFNKPHKMTEHIFNVQ